MEHLWLYWVISRCGYGVTPPGDSLGAGKVKWWDPTPRFPSHLPQISVVTIHERSLLMLFIVARSVIHCHSTHLHNSVQWHVYCTYMHICHKHQKKLDFFKDMACRLCMPSSIDCRAHYDLVRMIFEFCNFKKCLGILGSSASKMGWDGIYYRVWLFDSFFFYFHSAKQCLPSTSVSLVASSTGQ